MLMLGKVAFPASLQGGGGLLSKVVEQLRGFVQREVRPLLAFAYSTEP